MKHFTFLVIFCFLANTLAEKLEDELNAVERDCIKEKELSKYEQGSPDLENPTHKMKMFSGCLLGRVNFVKDGNLQEDVILQKSKNSMHPKFYKNCIRKCRDIKGSDNDDIAYKMILCFKKVEKEEYLQEWKTTCEDCRKEVKLSEEEYTKLQNLPVDNPSPAMKQYTACVFEKESFLKDNLLQENVVLEVAKDYNDSDYLKTFVEKCKQIHEDNQNDTALKLFECLQKIKNTHVE